MCDYCEKNSRKADAQIKRYATINARLKEDNAILQEKLAVMQLTIDKLQQTSSSPQHIQNVSFCGLSSDQPTLEELSIDHFDEYLDELLEKYLPLQNLLQIYTTNGCKRKESASTTTDQWRTWSIFYDSFIADTFLRSKNPKSVLRTNIALGVYFLQVNIPQSAWRLLERLRIICSCEFAENFVKSQPERLIANNRCIVYSLDNCDFYRHITHVRKSHRSDYLHIITQFAAEIVHPAVAVPARQVFHRVDAGDFGKWIENTDKKVLEVVNNAASIVGEVPKDIPLQFALKGADSRTPKSKITHFPADIDATPAQLADIMRILDRIYDTFIKTGIHEWMFISGDHQVFSKLWTLKQQNPEKYKWTIPIPGEWHYTWHVLKGIFHLWGHQLLKPLSQIIRYAKLDLEAKVFRYAEDFLQIVTVAILVWLSCFHVNFPGFSYVQILNALKPNSHAYELLYACIYYFCPY